MKQIPEALKALAAFRQFILFKLVPSIRPGKLDKIPLSPLTCQPFPKGSNWQQDPSQWVSADEAIAAASALGPEYGVGFLFTPNDPFFLLDIDGCVNTPDAEYATLVGNLLQYFAGCCVETSSSGEGLHVIGSGAPSTPTDDRRKKSTCNRMEFYTEKRFVALTGLNATGTAATIPPVGTLDWLIAAHFTAASGPAGPQEWTTEPVAGYSHLDDSEILQRACSQQSAGNVFGGKASFADLFSANADALAQAYPDEYADREYDGSSVDAALAQHLAFWTGKNCERIQSLMMQSALVRDKWEREDYLYRTITGAVARQDAVYTGPQQFEDSGEWGALKGTERQVQWAGAIRARKLAEIENDSTAVELLARETDAKWWIDNKDRSAADLAQAITPVESVPVPPAAATAQPQLVSGYQYLGATQQIEFFEGCVYIQSEHKILTPAHGLLKQDQFNVRYGGFVFQLDETGRKTTRKAWEAFTESQLIRFPKAHETCFRPDMGICELSEHEGLILANTYSAPRVISEQGDIQPFITHLEKLFPSATDREIIVSYMAACVQLKGVKFQWAPLIQGVPGNGKTLFSRCVAYAVGERHTHFPRAQELGEKYNAWLFDKIFIGVEDIYIPEQRRELIEVLKPMLTGERLECRAMHSDKTMKSVCANFIFNSNHRDAVQKTTDDRRFAPFFTPQQTADCLARDGMTAEYFGLLYGWLRGGGYKNVAHYLQTYEITDAFRQQLLYRAPETTSTAEAVEIGQGKAEQEILETIREGRPGFIDGWISSVALKNLLDSIRKSLSPYKRAQLIESLGFIPHPGLPDGRSTRLLPGDENKRPRLYVRKGHLSLNLSNPDEIINAYLKAQGHAVGQVNAA